jgi:glycosyltransferase involved in cell wall biosynthesis
VIPCFNTADRLEGVLSKILRFIPRRAVWVVDDGSADGTAKVASSAGVRILGHGRNRGKGAALRTGFRACLAAGAGAVLTIDGDGQHDAGRFPAFWSELARGADLVVGLRPFRVPEMPPDRIFSNWASSLIVSVASGVRVRDSQCGFRLYRRVALERALPATDRYEAETEMLIRALRSGFRVGWCPVANRYDGQPSHIRRLPDTVRFLRVIGKFL